VVFSNIISLKGRIKKMPNQCVSSQIKQQQIPEQMARLFALAESLHNSIEKLYERTRSVWCETLCVSSEKAIGKESTQSVPLAQDLKNLAEKIELSILSLDDLHKRIEL
jgi:hypothetical protein